MLLALLHSLKLVWAAVAKQQLEPMTGKESDVSRSFNTGGARLATLHRQSSRSYDIIAISKPYH
jgi:hypothetical protein